MDVHPWPVLYETILSGLNLLVAHLDRDFNFIRVNENYAAADGRPPDLYPGKNYFELYPHAENKAIFRRVLETGEPYRASGGPFEFPAPSERGASRWNWLLQPVFDRPGQVGELVLALVEVTPHLPGRQDLIDTRSPLGGPDGADTGISPDLTAHQVRAGQEIARQAFLLDNISDAVIAADKDLRITAWNRAAERMYGWSSAEATGHSIMEIPPTIRHNMSFEQALDRIAESGQLADRVIQLTKDGREIVVDYHANLLRDSHAQIEGYITVNRDVTQAEKIQEKLAYQAFLLDNIADAVFATDQDFIITACNRSAERLYEWKSQEVLGKPLFEALDTDLVDMTLEDSIQQLKGSGAVSGRAVRRARDGRTIHIDFRSVALKNAAGGTVGYVSVNRDVTDLIGAQEQIAYQSLLLENVGDAVIATDNDLVVTYWNRAAQDIYGWTAAEAVGKNASQLLKSRLHDSERAQQLNEMDRHGLVKNRAIQSAKDGRRIVIDHHTLPVRDRAGRRIGIMSVNRDVTEQVKAEEEAAFQAYLLANVGEAIFSTDADLRITYWNKTAERIYGWTSAEVLGKSAPDLLQSQPVGKNIDQVIEELHHSDTLAGQTTHATKDGRRIYIDYRAISLRDEAGNFRGVLTNNQDITDQIRAETERREVEARFRSIFEYSRSAIALLDTQAVFLSCNPAYERLLGCSQDELIGKSLYDITHPQDVEQERSLFQDLITGQRDSYQTEKRLVRKDGSPVWVNVVRSSVKEPDGPVRFVIGMNDDISKRKALEAELRQLRRRQFESLEADRLHLARELHDGPIQVLFGIDYQISGMLEALGEPYASDLGFIRAQALDVINALRQMSLDLRPPDTQLYGLEQAIMTHIDYFQQNFPNIMIHLNLAADMRQLSPSVQLAYYRIFQQSLANVARHGEADRVDVQLSIEADHSILEIQDNGKGFEVPDDLIVMARDGHLGLIGIRERAEAIGGQLEIRSTPGRGTLIRVIAPLVF